MAIIHRTETQRQTKLRSTSSKKRELEKECRFPLVPVFRRLSKHTGTSFQSAMVTEMFLNCFSKNARIIFCQDKGHFVYSRGQSETPVPTHPLQTSSISFFPLRSCSNQKKKNSTSSAWSPGSRLITFHPIEVKSEDIGEVENVATDVCNLHPTRTDVTEKQTGSSSVPVVFEKSCAIFDVVNCRRSQLKDPCARDNIFFSTFQVCLRRLNGGGGRPNSISLVTECGRNVGQKVQRKVLLGPTGSVSSYPLPVVDVSLLGREEAETLQKDFGFQLISIKDRSTNIPCAIDNRYPIASCHVSVGHRYVPDYLLASGSGVYIEQHEMPHVHRPMCLQSKGWMLYAKPLKETVDSGSLPSALTFLFLKVPFGTYVVTKPWAWHADCFLVGAWEVLYSSDGQSQTFNLFEETNVNRFDGVQREINKV